MNFKRAALSFSLMLGTTLVVGAAWTAGPALAQDGVTLQMAQAGSDPSPAGGDQETTRKHRNPAKQQDAERNAQVTLGGSKYFVSGEVLKVEGDYYFVKDAESGDEVRLLVNQDTHVICAPASGGTGGSASSAVGKRGDVADKEATEQQMAQGQKRDETAAGTGFRIGPGSECQFKPGDKVKAEVSDVGTVTTLRYLSETTIERRPPMQFGSTRGTPDMKDKSPTAEELQKRAEGSQAPADLRGEVPAEASQQAKASSPKECEQCELIRGRVLKVEDEFLVVRDRSKREVRLHMDRNTIIGQRNVKDEPFKEGDRVEAYVTPKGHIHSISLIRGQGGIPGDVDAGG